MMAGYAVISIGELLGVGERPRKKKHTTSRAQGDRSRIYEEIQEIMQGKKQEK